VLLGNLVEHNFGARNIGDESLSNYKQTTLECFRNNFIFFLRNRLLTSHGVLLVLTFLMSRVPLMSSAVLAMLNDKKFLTLHDYLCRFSIS